MSTLSQTQRQFLRRAAHDLKPTVQIGKNGVTPQLLASVEQELDARELVKIKFLDYRDEKRDLAEQIADQAGAALVALIGNIAVVFRQHRDPEKRKVHMPREDE
jgi:RNA-binding protein